LDWWYRNMQNEWLQNWEKVNLGHKWAIRKFQKDGESVFNEVW